MKHPFEALFPFLLLVLFCALCVRPAHAVGSGLVPSSKVTSGNPMGYGASVDGGGNVNINTQLMVIAQPPPAGQSVSAGLTAAAMLVGGGAVLAPEGTFQAALNNPAAAIAAASTFIMAGGTAISPFNPAVGVPLVAAGLALQGGLATCQLVGCHFLDGLKTQGVTVNPDGTAVKIVSGFTAPGTPQACAGKTAQTLVWGSAFTCLSSSDALAGCNSIGSTLGVSGWSCVASSSSYALQYTFHVMTLNYSSPSTTSPVTNTDVVAAITAASTSANFKADMVNLGLQNGMAMIADAQTAQNTQVASAFTQLSSSTDALGNVVQTLARNITSIAPGANSSLPPVVTNSIQQVTVTNAVPTSTTSTTIANPAAAAVASTTGQTPTQDMCLQHPDILACADISKLNDLPAVTPLTDTKNIGALSPVAVGVGFAICPAPIVLPGMMGGPPMFFDVWKYPCEFAGYIKPINIIGASIASIYILMGAFKNG